MKVAIVSDNLTQRGGAERVVELFHGIFPTAPIYTSVYDQTKVYPSFKEMDIRPSFIQRLPLSKRYFRHYFWLYPYAFERFDFSQYDLVISCSHAFAKGVAVPEKIYHLCYCFTPMRFAWNYQEYVKGENLGFIIRKSLPLFINWLKKWDQKTAKRVDRFVAISSNVAEKITKFYNREATVIHPPIDTSKYTLLDKAEDYFLIVSRLVPYKRIDLVIEAFNTLKLPLKIIGEGRDRHRLAEMAKPNIEFLGNLSDEELKEYYAKCQALIFPGEEDFGLAPIEAMASGRPVIAYARGGVLETVVEGVTGKFFYEQTPQTIIETIKEFNANSHFNPQEIREQTLKFDKEIFKQKFTALVAEKFG